MRKWREMRVIVATADSRPGPARQGRQAFEPAIAGGHDEPAVELYGLKVGADRLVMLEKYESDQAAGVEALIL
jgi:hypothetical protein